MQRWGAAWLCQAAWAQLLLDPSSTSSMPGGTKRACKGAGCPWGYLAALLLHPSAGYSTQAAHTLSCPHRVQVKDAKCANSALVLLQMGCYFFSNVV